jgi:hypothetical protein
LTKSEVLKDTNSLNKTPTIFKTQTFGETSKFSPPPSATPIATLGSATTIHFMTVGDPFSEAKGNSENGGVFGRTNGFSRSQLLRSTSHLTKSEVLKDTNSLCLSDQFTATEIKSQEIFDSDEFPAAFTESEIELMTITVGDIAASLVSVVSVSFVWIASIIVLGVTGVFFFGLSTYLENDLFNVREERIVSDTLYCSD